VPQSLPESPTRKHLLDSVARVLDEAAGGKT